MFSIAVPNEPTVAGSSSTGALRSGDHSDRADYPICSPQYPNLRRTRSRPVPMGLCAVSRWCEGADTKAKRSSCLDRISERITLAFRTLSRPEAIRGSTIEKRGFSLYLNKIWRGDFQSTPVDVPAIFHSRASEPTVLATRYWASSPARAVLGEQEIARLLALLGITHHDRHNVRLTEHHGQACCIEHGLYPHRVVLMAGSRSIAKS